MINFVKCDFCMPDHTNFCIRGLQLLALGNQVGKVTLWDMTTEDTSKSKYVIIISGKQVVHGIYVCRQLNTLL